METIHLIVIATGFVVLAVLSCALATVGGWYWIPAIEGALLIPALAWFYLWVGVA